MIDRSRMTERLNLSLLRIELKRAIRPLVVVLIGFVAAAVAGNYILSNINGGIGSTHTMQFEVADATGVVPGRAEVRFYGIAAGQVTDVKLVNGHAVLTATVADKFGNVYKNAQAEVRPNTALDDMYLDVVNRGTPSAGVASSGYLVPLSQTQSPVNLADVLNTFQPDVRTQLYNILDQFGNGLADRGDDLRQSFAMLAPLLKVAGNVSSQLAVRATLTKQLVHNASHLSVILASRSRQLRGLVTNGTATLDALSTEGGSPLRETISKLPATMDTIASTWTVMKNALPNLRSAVTGLVPVSHDLSSGLRSIKSFATSAEPAVERLQKPVTELSPVADDLTPLSSGLATSLTEISPQVKDVDANAADAAKCVPFINEFFNWDASMSKFSDTLGTMVRGNLHVGFYSLPNQTQNNYVYDYPCAGGRIIGDTPTPKYDGPAPAP